MENSELSDACAGQEAALLQSQYKGGISTYGQLGIFIFPLLRPFYYASCSLMLEDHTPFPASHAEEENDDEVHAPPSPPISNEDLVLPDITGLCLRTVYEQWWCLPVPVVCDWSCRPRPKVGPKPRLILALALVRRVQLLTPSLAKTS